MDLVELPLLLVTGVVAGMLSSMAGLASLVSYPVLLAMGLPPVAANVTNTVSMSGAAVGAAVSSQPELAGRRAQILGFGSLAVLMGAGGALLLLTTPASSFEFVVPVLIGLASVALYLRPRLQQLGTGRLPDRHPLVLVGISAVTLYAGYFGAAAGVMMLAVLGAVMTDSHAHVNAMRNVLLGLANVTAAVGFALFGPVDWAAVVPLTLGLFAGGFAGPKVVRRVDQDRLRVVTAVAGLGVAIVLGARTYA